MEELENIGPWESVSRALKRYERDGDDESLAVELARVTRMAQTILRRRAVEILERPNEGDSW